MSNNNIRKIQSDREQYASNKIDSMSAVDSNVEGDRLLQQDSLSAAIYNITRFGLSDEATLPEFFRTLHSELKQLFDFEDFYISLYNGQTLNMVFREGPGIRRRIPELPYTRENVTGLSEHVAETGKPLRLDAAMLREYYEQYALEDPDDGVMTWMGSPIPASEGVTGVMCLQSGKPEQAFTEQHLTDFFTITQHAGLILHHIEKNRKLKEGEQTRNTLLSNIEKVVYVSVYNAEKPLLISGLVEKVIGYHKEEIQYIPTFWLEHIHPEDAKSTLEQWKAFEHSEASTTSMQYRFKHKVKGYIWLYERISKTMKEGKLMVYGSLRDITELVEYRDAAKAIDLRYHMLMETIQDGITVTDADHRIIYCNPSFREITGHTEEEILKPDFASKLLFADETKKMAEHAKIQESLRPSKYQYTFETPKGIKKTILVNESPITNEKGEYNGSIAVHTDITLLNRSREELSASQEKLIKAQRLANIGNWELDMEANRIHLSRQCFYIFGYEEEEFTDLMDVDQISRMVLDEDKQKVDDYYEKCVQSEEDDYVEFRICNTKGELRYLRSKARRKERDGRLFLEGVSQDITELKQKEMEAGESRDMLIQMAEALHDCFWMYDIKEGKQLFVNSAYEQIFELSCESLYQNSKSLLDRIHPADLDRVIRSHNVTTLSKPYEIEYRLSFDNGERIKWVKERSFPVFKDGHLHRTAGFTQDVTAKRAIEHEVQKLSEIMENTSEMVAVANNEGKIEYVNAAFEQVSGHKNDELIGKDLITTTQFGTLPNSRDYIMKRLLDGKEFKDEFVSITKDGKVYYEDKIFTPIRNSLGEITHIASQGRNITERKKAEKELASMSMKNINLMREREELKVSSLIKGQDAERSRISLELHDGLGQLLAAARFQLSMLEKEEQKNEEMLEEMKKVIEHAITESKRISYNLMPSVLIDFGLEAAVRKILDIGSLQNVISIGLESDVGTNRYPEETETQVFRIIQEAVSNAMKHSHGNKVSVLLTEKDGLLYASVQDDGIGFDPDEKLNIKRREASMAIGNGLLNMLHRSKLINAELRINATKEEGTTIEILTKNNAL